MLATANNSNTTTTTFSSVQATFDAPIDGFGSSHSNTCTGTAFQWVLHWVGIDGDVVTNESNHAANVNVLQDGLSNKLSCAGAGDVGIEQIEAFIEYYPRDPVTIVDFSSKIAFGDSITVMVSQVPATGTAHATGYVAFTDSTQSLSFNYGTDLSTSTAASPFNPNEAEVVVEPPCNSDNNGVCMTRYYPPNFNPFTFTAATAVDNTGAIDDLTSDISRQISGKSVKVFNSFDLIITEGSPKTTIKASLISPTSFSEMVGYGN